MKGKKQDEFLDEVTKCSDHKTIERNLWIFEIQFCHLINI
jgi:hypothetical protein